MRKKISFELSAFEDFKYWARSERKTYYKIIKLLKAIQNRSSILEKQPEPLKRELDGYWSIEIDEEHRLVYKLTDTKIIIAACKYHYN